MSRSSMHVVLLHLLRRSFDGGAWHGPALADALVGVDARTALARPVPDAHTIWELTHHVGAWSREVARRLGGAPPSLPAEGDWPEPIEQGDARAVEASWAAVRASLDVARDTVLAAVRDFPSERLDAHVGDASGAPVHELVTFGQMVIGVAEHNAYHGGQIMLLRRMLDAGRVHHAHQTES